MAETSTFPRGCSNKIGAAGDGKPYNGGVVTLDAAQDQVRTVRLDRQVVAIVDHHDPHLRQFRAEGVRGDDRPFDDGAILSGLQIGDRAEFGIRQVGRELDVEAQFLGRSLLKYIGFQGRGCLGILVGEDQHPGSLRRFAYRLFGRVEPQARDFILHQDLVQVVVRLAAQIELCLSRQQGGMPYRKDDARGKCADASLEQVVHSCFHSKVSIGAVDSQRSWVKHHRILD